MTNELEPQRTSLDPITIHAQLSEWVANVTGEKNAIISEFDRPSGSGMSSETLLFESTWGEGEKKVHKKLVARLAPTDQDIPVFPTYDLSSQVKVMKLVEQLTDIKVPKVLWEEPSIDVLGVPFFVMEQVPGRVPPDIPPYVFGGWLLDATPESQLQLQELCVGIIAQLHQIKQKSPDTDFLEFRTQGETALKRHFTNQKEYYRWVTQDNRQHPVIEQAFDWLESHWPEESETVVSWGDARIGNIMFGSKSLEPVAVLDWEMAGLAPVEVDLGWMIFMHKFFQVIAEALEFPGMPKFMTSRDVTSKFTDLTGIVPKNIDWFEIYAATRHAIIMSRINDRSVHFGESEWTDDVDSAIPHRDYLWSRIQ